MEKILLLTDSAHDIPRDEAERRPIHVVPMIVTYENQEYREFYDLDPKAYWQTLTRLKDIPVTAMISPERWREGMQYALQQGYTHVLCITISSTGSGTHNSACVAAELMRDSGLTVRVVDSLTYSMIYGQVILECADRILEGRSFDEICTYAEQKLARREALLWVYTLRHLKRSGRISGMAAFVGEAMGLRPLLLVKTGHIEPVAKVRGDRALIPKMAELLRERAENPESQDMILLYADMPEAEIAAAEQAIRDAVNPRTLRRYPIGVSVATNTGPQSLAVIYDGRIA